ncbi:unnamed protein product [Paramecium octaurelia]|uniref:Uncharacterized protein n=1 Tax=Paramecium octaurelia TaxID=43137 RepID=A0A8S1WVX6_PAROT|nr:unnamed protein product [Paramecium octaurelia]
MVCKCSQTVTYHQTNLNLNNLYSLLQMVYMGHQAMLETIWQLGIIHLMKFKFENNKKNDIQIYYYHLQTYQVFNFTSQIFTIY